MNRWLKKFFTYLVTPFSTFYFFDSFNICLFLFVFFHSYFHSTISISIHYQFSLLSSSIFFNFSIIPIKDRFYVGYNNEKPLEDSGISLFKTIIYDVIKKEISSAIISLINQERENIQIDRDLIKKSVEIFEAMGMGSLETYEIDLETPLIESTK